MFSVLGFRRSFLETGGSWIAADIRWRQTLGAGLLFTAFVLPATRAWPERKVEVSGIFMVQALQVWQLAVFNVQGAGQDTALLRSVKFNSSPQ